MRKGLRDAIKKKCATFSIFHCFVFYFSTLKEILLFLSVTIAVKMIKLWSLFTHLELILSLFWYETVLASLAYWSTFIVFILSSSCCQSELKTGIIRQDFSLIQHRGNQFFLLHTFSIPSVPLAAMETCQQQTERESFTQWLIREDHRHQPVRA